MSSSSRRRSFLQRDDAQRRERDALAVTLDDARRAYRDEAEAAARRHDDALERTHVALEAEYREEVAGATAPLREEASELREQVEAFRQQVGADLPSLFLLYLLGGRTFVLVLKKFHFLYNLIFFPDFDLFFLSDRPANSTGLPS